PAAHPDGLLRDRRAPAAPRREPLEHQLADAGRHPAGSRRLRAGPDPTGGPLMCTPYGGDGSAADPRSLAEVDLDRRHVLRLGAAGGAGIVLSTALDSPVLAAKGRKRAYVIVLDGMIPGEIDSGLMPRLKALRDAGTAFPNARSLPIMETIPNHVMMMTGVRPRRNGVPANAIYDRRAKIHRDLDRPSDLRFPTVIERLRKQGFSTGTVLSKEYLYGIFGTRANHRWEPFPIIPISGHAPDLFT